MYLSRGTTLPEAYHKALKQIDYFGKYVSCPDYNTTIRELSPLTMIVEEPTKEPFISKVFPGGFHELQQYIMEVNDGILDFMVGIDENVWEYTYHQRIGKQLDFVAEELIRNPYSRRAVINLRDNEVDQATDHPACLQHIQFMIREAKLNMSVLMRSNDALNATFMNAVAFIEMQKRLAKRIGVEVGEYTHTANSFHVYEKDFDKFNAAIDRIHDWNPDVTYNYEGEWKPLMEAEIPSIMAMVKDQKRKYGVV